MEGFKSDESFAKLDAILLRTLGFIGTEILAIMEIKNKGVSPAVQTGDENPVETSVSSLFLVLFRSIQLRVDLYF